MKTILFFVLFSAFSACASLPKSPAIVLVEEHQQVAIHFAQVNLKNASPSLALEISAKGARAAIPAGRLQVDYLSAKGDVLHSQTLDYAGANNPVHRWYKAGDKIQVVLNASLENTTNLRVRFEAN